MARIESAAEIGKEMRRNRVKSKCVSSGTMRSGGIRSSTATTVSTAIRMPSPMRTNCVKAAPDSNWHGLRPLPSDPAGDDQAGQGKCGEHGGDDADAECHGETADGPGTDIEQHGGGD